jgi:hypothetical protein
VLIVVGGLVNIDQPHTYFPGVSSSPDGIRQSVSALRETSLFHRCPHCFPVRLSDFGRSSQFGRASAPMIPHEVHTIRGPKDGTGTASPN